MNITKILSNLFKPKIIVILLTVIVFSVFLFNYINKNATKPKASGGVAYTFSTNNTSVFFPGETRMQQFILTPSIGAISGIDLIFVPSSGLRITTITSSFSGDTLINNPSSGRLAQTKFVRYPENVPIAINLTLYSENGGAGSLQLSNNSKVVGTGSDEYYPGPSASEQIINYSTALTNTPTPTIVCGGPNTYSKCGPSGGCPDNIRCTRQGPVIDYEYVCSGACGPSATPTPLNCQQRSCGIKGIPATVCLPSCGQCSLTTHTCTVPVNSPTLTTTPIPGTPTPTPTIMPCPSCSGYTYCCFYPSNVESKYELNTGGNYSCGLNMSCYKLKTSTGPTATITPSPTTGAVVGCACTNNKCTTTCIDRGGQTLNNFVCASNGNCSNTFSRTIGDATGDGRVCPADYNEYVKASLGLYNNNATNRYRVDTDGNGLIDPSTDLIQIKAHLQDCSTVIQ